jgi:hypothetical protein
MKSSKMKHLLALGAIVFVGVNSYSLTVSVAPGGDIQAAINSVSAAGGGTVNITSGTATISTALTVPSNVTINGAGNPTTTLNLSSGVTTGFQVPSTAWSAITVQNIKINGAGTSVDQDGVEMAGTGSSNSGGKLSNVQVLNTGYTGVNLACNNGSVTSCNFHSCGNSDLQHNLYFSGGSSTVISGCTLNSSLNGSGLHLNNWAVISGGESLNNTTSSNGQNGHSFTASTSDTFNDYTINGCTADDNGGGPGTGGAEGYGFYLGAGSGTIENCTATGNLTENYYDGGFSSSNNH